jgi:hypothetical protein
MAEGAKLYVLPGEIGDRKVYVVRKDYEEPKDHPPIEISVSLQDSVHWISYEKKFRVKKLVPKPENSNRVPPPQPFYREFPEPTGTGPTHAYQVNSGPARPEAIGFTYEALFEFEDGSGYDPHIKVNP